MKWYIDGDQLAITTDYFVNLQESPAVFIPLDSQRACDLQEKGIFALGYLAVTTLYRDMWRQLGPEPACPNWRFPKGMCGACDYCEIAGWLL